MGKPSEKTGSQKFTVDNDKTGAVEMPGVTRLLNRKSLKDLANYQGGDVAPPLPDSPEGATPSIDLPFEGGLATPTETETVSELDTSHLGAEQKEPEIFAASETTAPPTIGLAPSIRPRPAQRAKKKTHAPLTIWTPASLATNRDPMAMALIQLIPKGLISALFLETSAPAPGSKVSLFASQSTFQPGSKLAVWEGLKWDPLIVPKIWHLFTQSGMVELAPPKGGTSATSDRNVVRTAFGIEAAEWLTLIQVGPIDRLRGALAVVSSLSVSEHVIAQKLLFLSALPGQSSQDSKKKP